MSDLIRTAVEEYIATDGNSAGAQLNDEVDELLTSLNNVDSQLGNIEDFTGCTVGT